MKSTCINIEERGIMDVRLERYVTGIAVKSREKC